MFSSDGQWLATGGEHRLKLWDTTTWRSVSTSQTPLDFDWMSRYGMAFSRDARMLATANGASVKFWEVPSLKELPDLKGDIGRAGSLAFSKDDEYLVTGRANGAIDVWEVSTRQKVDTLRKHNGWVSVLAFSEDGQTFASASADQTIVLWSLEKRSSLATLKGHSHEVWALAFSPDSQTLASGSVDETIKFWNVSARRSDEVLEDAYAPLSFSPDDRSLAFVGKKRVKFYDLATRQTAEFPAPVTAVTLRSLCNVAISSDHRTLAIGRSNGMVEIWDVHKKERLAAVEGYPGAKILMALSPDGKTLAVASGNSPVKVWDVDNQQEIATFSGYDISSLAFSPQGDTLAVGSHPRATLWDVRSKRKLATLEGHKNFVEGLGFSPDGKLMATASADSTAKIWEAHTGRELVTLTGHTEGVFAVCFTPDGRALATAGGDDRVRLWSLATYQEMASLPGQEDGQWITFSCDGNTMATGGWEHDTVRISAHAVLRRNRSGGETAQIAATIARSSSPPAAGTTQSRCGTSHRDWPVSWPKPNGIQSFQPRVGRLGDQSSAECCNPFRIENAPLSCAHVYRAKHIDRHCRCRPPVAAHSPTRPRLTRPPEFFRFS